MRQFGYEGDNNADRIKYLMASLEASIKAADADAGVDALYEAMEAFNVSIIQSRARKRDRE